MVETVAQQMEAGGLGAMIGGPFGFIPYKVYAVQAGRQHHGVDLPVIDPGADLLVLRLAPQVLDPFGHRHEWL